jgi:hypothetical protein
VPVVGGPRHPCDRPVVCLPGRSAPSTNQPHSTPAASPVMQPQGPSRHEGKGTGENGTVAAMLSHP